MIALLLLVAQSGPPAWEDRDFSAAAVDRAGVIALPDGGAWLASDESKLGASGEAFKRDVIADMALFQGRLFALASFRVRAEGQTPGDPAGSQLLEYDPVEGWKGVRDLADVALNLREIGGRLHFASFDGDVRRVNIFDGKDWSELEPIAAPLLHGMDILAFKSCIYWAGSWVPESEEELREHPEAAQGKGVIFRSDDRGKSWVEDFRDTEPGRILELAVFDGALVANRRGMVLIRREGTTWKDVPLDLRTRPGQKALLGDARLRAFSGALLAVNPPLSYRYDGSAWSSSVPGAVALFPDGASLLGLRDDGNLYRTNDGTTWRKLTTAGAPAEEFNHKVGVGLGVSLPKLPIELPKEAAKELAKLFKEGHSLRRGSVAAWAGKLFAGGGLDGRIFESTFVAKGTLLTPPHPAGSGRTLTWDATVPEGAMLTASVRFAPDEAHLARARWVEVGASPAAAKPPVGDHVMQVRFQFGSEGRRSAVLRSVRWD